jgi:uncharacterized protein (DUF433 family)
MDTNLIQSDPDVMMGKAVIAGTRITVELILEKLSAGETVEQILEAHPRLTREAVLAALAYAAQNLPNPLKAA